MKKYGLAFILLVVMLSGCQQNADGLYEQQEDESGARLITNTSRGGVENQAGVEDDYDRDRTTDEQNPNFVNFDGGRVNRETDVDKARYVIQHTDEFKPGAVLVNGNKMRVTAYKEGRMSTKEKRAAEKRLHKVLIKALPRYRINVEVQQDRR